ncbi:unnamed protein product, partial [marine sediment metagenome]
RLTDLNPEQAALLVGIASESPYSKSSVVLHAYR